MIDIIQQHWKAEELPGIDCLLMQDGSVIILNAYTLEDGQRQVSPLCETSTVSLESFHSDIWSEIQLSDARINTEQGVFVCGEGAMGNEGFIACVDHEQHLIWALYLTDSNPFLRLDLADNILIALSSDDHEYRINTRNPEQIEVIRRS